MNRTAFVVCAIVALQAAAAVACSDEEGATPSLTQDGGTGTFDAAPTPAPTATADGSANPNRPDGGSGDAAVEAGKVLPDGLLEPVPYTSRADSPFTGVVLASYSHFEDWEDSALSTPGVTSSSNQLGTAFGASLVDSIDGDDGVIDGKCEKAGSSCNSAFAGGTIEFTFDAAVLGALPTHVGIAWTDGSTGCDAIFEAFDANDQPLGSKTAAGVGDNSNTGTVAEDRWFGVVHAAGVKRIVVKSSGGGVEVDHLHYGR